MFVLDAGMECITNITEVLGVHMKLAEWLFLDFLTLKLCGVIAWSWWWVLAPLWGAIALGVIKGLIKPKSDETNS